MPLHAFANIFAVKGKIATDIRENRPTLTSSLIVLLAGIIYGLAVFYFKSAGNLAEQNNYYLVFAILFGFLYMVVSQIGITLLLWAMCRLLKGKTRLMALFSAVGYSFLPYGLLAAIVASLNHFTFNKLLAVMVALACFIWWFFALARIVHYAEGFSLQKSYLVVVFCLVFLVSFIYVVGY